ncbi:6776_t:CDS:2, partial [Funneliformis caledonium]
MKDNLEHCTAWFYNQDTSRKKTDALEMWEIENILNSPNMQTDTLKGLTYSVWFWLTLLCNLRGGGAKNLYNAGRHNYIPADQPNNYSPVADILLYQSKRPKDCKFFLRINTSRKIYHSNWFCDSTLGKHSHDNMLKNIIADCKIDAKGRNL